MLVSWLCQWMKSSIVEAWGGGGGSNVACLSNMTVRDQHSSVACGTDSGLRKNLPRTTANPLLVSCWFNQTRSFFVHDSIVEDRSTSTTTVCALCMRKDLDPVSVRVRTCSQPRNWFRIAGKRLTDNKNNNPVVHQKLAETLLLRLGVVGQVRVHSHHILHQVWMLSQSFQCKVSSDAVTHQLDAVDISAMFAEILTNMVHL